MPNVQNPDTAPDPTIAAPTIPPEGGDEVLPTNPSVSALDLFNRARMSEGGPSWERFTGGFTKVGIGNDPTLVHQLGGTADNDYERYKNVNYHLWVSHSSSTAYGHVQLYWFKWNAELKSSLTASDIGDLLKDYTINRRERAVPYVGTSAGGPYEYRTRFPALRLQPEETWALFAAAVGGTGTSGIIIRGVLTGHRRAQERGEL